MFYLYVIRTSDNRLYIGHTSNLERRLRDHRSKNGARFMRGCDQFTLVHSEGFPSRLEAIRREKQLKGWTRAKKEALVSSDLELLKKL